MKRIVALLIGSLTCQLTACGDPGSSNGDARAPSDTAGPDTSVAADAEDVDSDTTSDTSDPGSSDTLDATDTDTTTDTDATTDTDTTTDADTTTDTDADTTSDADTTTASPRWSVLVYMAADNNLEDDAVGDLKEMLAAGASDQLRFIVQVDRSPAHSTRAVPGLGNWTGAKRLVIDGSGLHEVANLGAVNMADPNVLADFIRWGLTTYPAERRVLDLWDHGAGWVGYGADESTAGHPILSIATLKDGISRGLANANVARFDVLGFDACLMATYEVARTLSPYADGLLASQEIEPGHGWDYKSFSALRDNPSLTPRALASRIITGFFAQASQARDDTELTLSYLDLTRMNALEQALTAFSSRLATVDAASMPTIGQSLSSAISFGKSPDPTHAYHLVDLGTFIKGLESLSAISAQATQLRQALAAVVLENRTGPATRGAMGLSIYFPPLRSLYNRAYDTVSAMADWRGFLNAYYDGGASAPPLKLTGNGTIGWVEGAAVLDINVTSPPLATLVDARGYGGVIEGDTALMTSTFPAERGGSTLRVAWYGELAILSQGTSTTFGFLDYSEDTTTHESYVDIPFFYIAPNGDTTYVIRNDVLLPDGSLLGSDLWYEYTEVGIGELWVDPGGRLVPLNLVFGPDGESWQTSDTSFDATRPIQAEIDNAFAYLEPGTTIYLELQVSDFAGQVDYTGGTLQIPIEGGCGDITDVGICQGSVLYYCDSGQLLAFDCASDGGICGYNAEEQ
ncbi:MAG: hypothetical protein JNJ59_17550, partial [Deltaproteobacteria bacterium]|nr:hypothetical protein [Deltaproteobacteria bacterium]